LTNISYLSIIDNTVLENTNLAHMGGSSSWPCVAITTHEFLKKFRIFSLATKFSVTMKIGC